jgi:hypothetical protein
MHFAGGASREDDVTPVLDPVARERLLAGPQGRLTGQRGASGGCLIPLGPSTPPDHGLFFRAETPTRTPMVR